MPLDGSEVEFDFDLQVKNRIESALSTLEEKGWCQNELQDTDGRVCLLGAFGVGYGQKKDLATREALRLVARSAHCDHYTCLWQYNDKLPEMTGKYVVRDLLRRSLRSLA